MRLLLSTDLHFSDAPKDRYRFEFIPHLAKQARDHRVELIVLLGDLTVKKDNHSALLVNLIVAGLRTLTSVCPVHVLKGNHDYLADPTLPFFKFINHIDGITLMNEPVLLNDMLYVPHLTSMEQWLKVPQLTDKAPTVAFIHQTVSGAISESGQRLDGFPLKPMKQLRCPVYGGDIHKPQTIGPVTYIGPPYHIKFGDNFIPRYLLFDTEKGTHKELHFDCPRKWMLTIRDPEELLKDKRIRAGDQVKVRLEMTREEIVEWKVKKDLINRTLEKLEVESYGIELRVEKQTKVKDRNQRRVNQGRNPHEIVRDFSKREKLSTVIRNTGLELLNR